MYWNDENETAEKTSILGDFRPGVLRGVIIRHILIATWNYLTEMLACSSRKKTVSQRRSYVAGTNFYYVTFS